MVEAKRRIGLFLTIAFLLSILVAGLVYQQVSAVEAELGERVSIYVAAREIPAQVLIEATDLEPVEVPRAYLHRARGPNRAQPSPLSGPATRPPRRRANHRPARAPPR
jgi:hypothetical protein